jgi:hypothetical protein
MSKGFASLSPEQRRRVSRKGGKTAAERGTKHIYSTQEASAASLKGVAVRKRKAALDAATRLIGAGFSPLDLGTLALTDDEWIYYGGKTHWPKRVGELKERLTNEEKSNVERKTLQL